MNRIALLLVLLTSSVALAQVKVSTAITSGNSVLAVVAPATAVPGQRLVTLTWTEATPGVTFKVYRGITAGGEDYTSPLGTTGIGVLTYVDVTVASGTTYYYTVTAFSTIESVPSNEAIAVV